MRVGGWTRIGIVLSVLYGMLVCVVAYDSRPRLEYKRSAWFSEAADAIAEVLTDTEKQQIRSYDVREKLLKGTDEENIAWLENVAAAPSERQKLFSSQLARVNEKHRAAMSGLPAEKRTHWLLAFVWWVAGTGLLFALGWTVRWVYRGFRPPAA